MEPMQFPRDNLVRAMRPGAEIREADDGAPPTMFGHFAKFNEWTRIDSAFEGTFMERIAPGSFTKAFQEPYRAQIKPVFQHGEDPQMGDKVLGIPSILEQQQAGAYYEVPLFRGIPDLLLEGMRQGAYGSSFKFNVKREHVERNVKESAHNPDALPERTIQEALVWDFGPVTWPAYEGATTGVRSLTDEFLIARLARHPEQLQRLLVSANLDALVTAPSKSDAADEPHLRPERSAERVVVPVRRFQTQEGFVSWLTDRT